MKNGRVDPKKKNPKPQKYIRHPDSAKLSNPVTEKIMKHPQNPIYIGFVRDFGNEKS